MLYKASILAAATLAYAASSDYASSSDSHDEHTAMGDTCYKIKAAYQGSSCCNSNLQQVTDYHISPPPPSPMPGTNVCDGAKPTIEEAPGLYNSNCTNDGFTAIVEEQSGRDVTVGHVGLLETDAVPITSSYMEAGLCPVNVHWHLGTEHRSAGEYDEAGHGPHTDEHRRLGKTEMIRRRLGGDVRLGMRCHHYDSHDAKFTTPYDWKHCTGMEVGETYEVHWPHSNMGACGTPNQYQTPFYDGVFCKFATGTNEVALTATEEQIGVQAQVFTIVNDESYYYPDLMRGMIIDGDFAHDVAKYTGSTTGTTRNNEICSNWAPITWQVDRKCHLISASSFDKMCADMKSQRDDMSDDLYPHGSRELVADHLASDNLQRKQ